MKKIILSVALLLSSGSVWASLAERVEGFTTNAGGITFQVSSNGCTSKDSFRVENLESSPPQLQLIRQERDRCRAYMPYGTTIKYTWQEVHLQKGDEFKIANVSEVLRVK